MERNRKVQQRVKWKNPGGVIESVESREWYRVAIPSCGEIRNRKRPYLHDYAHRNG